jgi:hypothetical protein
MKLCQSCLLILTFVFLAKASVSFDIPEDHKDFPYLDSLYTQIVKLERIVTQKDKIYLSDPFVRRQKKFAAKEEFYDMLVESQTLDVPALLTFYATLKQYYHTRMLYFEKLLSILPPDDRAPCFALYRQARDNYGAIQLAILKYTPQEMNPGDE